MICKDLNKFTDEPYDKLLKNKILKSNYESKYLSVERKISELMEYLFIHKKIPKCNKVKFSNGRDMGAFWARCKFYKRKVYR